MAMGMPSCPAWAACAEGSCAASRGRPNRRSTANRAPAIENSKRVDLKQKGIATLRNRVNYFLRKGAPKGYQASAAQHRLDISRKMAAPRKLAVATATSSDIVFIRSVPRIFQRDYSKLPVTPWKPFIACFQSHFMTRAAL